MFKLLKNLQKQGIELFENFENRFSESNTFNLLKEKYQSLSLSQQKLLKYALLAFIFISVIYLPVSYMFSSIGSWSDFKQKYMLSLELLRVRGKGADFLNQSEEALKIKISKVIERYSSEGFEITDKKRHFSKAKSVRQVDFNISLKHLNIKQAVKLGIELHDLQQARLIEISLSESAEYAKHYDLIYKLEAFVSRANKAQAPVIKRQPRQKVKERAGESADKGQASVIKRQPITRQKKSSIQTEDKTDGLENQPIQKREKRKVRKRKAVGD